MVWKTHSVPDAEKAIDQAIRFMMADSMWVFCMALNVMLVFFHQYDSRRLRELEKWYLIFGYGIPFVPAVIYLIVERTTQQRIYGPATVSHDTSVYVKSFMLM